MATGTWLFWFWWHSNLATCLNCNQTWVLYYNLERESCCITYLPKTKEWDWLCISILVGNPDRNLSRIYLQVINPFLINIPLLYPLKTSKKQRFSDVFRGYRSGTLVENGVVFKNDLFLSARKTYVNMLAIIRYTIVNRRIHSLYVT